MAHTGITLWISHHAECPSCSSWMLFRGQDPREGDAVTCPRCKKSFYVEQICGDVRDEEDSPAQLDAELSFTQ